MPRTHAARAPHMAPDGGGGLHRDDFVQQKYQV